MSLRRLFLLEGMVFGFCLCASVSAATHPQSPVKKVDPDVSEVGDFVLIAPTQVKKEHSKLLRVTFFIPCANADAAEWITVVSVPARTNPTLYYIGVTYPASLCEAAPPGLYRKFSRFIDTADFMDSRGFDVTSFRPLSVQGMKPREYKQMDIPAQPVLPTAPASRD